ncbi:hypothetical protein [Amycolatopsis sp. cmx-11-51]|uniref:hypothetical protein n=1 Tax=unclassified Amycolatopsis TaxID=2618356 RepID=UPI0039E7104A
MAAGPLSKGGLRAMVEKYLTEHPGESFGPPESARVSAGHNTLEKLVADGYAIKPREAPKRFAITPKTADDDAEPALKA